MSAPMDVSEPRPEGAPGPARAGAAGRRSEALGRGEPPAAPPAAPPPPAVSVVIPTFRRPALVVEAARSALAQTLAAIEVVVVVDGEGCDGTAEALGALDDPRLVVLRPGRQLGNAGARNHGIAAARAPWIALLDDDDLWMPDKLERQMAEAGASDARFPVVSCRLLARTDREEFLWPRRLPGPHQVKGNGIAGYTLCRHRPSTGDGVVQTSTLLAPKALFGLVPFDAACRRFVDVDWLLRAARVEGVALLFAAPDRPLAVWRIDDRPRVSLGGGWREDVEWMRARRHLVPPRAYGGFMLTLPSIRAARERDRRAFLALLREAFRGGARPGWAEVAFHVGNFALGPAIRRRLAALNRR